MGLGVMMLNCSEGTADWTDGLVVSTVPAWEEADESLMLGKGASICGATRMLAREPR